MKPLDRLLQRWRNRKAAAEMAAGSRVLDVGCSDGALFRELSLPVREGVGLDPLADPERSGGPFRYVPGRFPDQALPEQLFDVIAFVATLEHFPPGDLPEVANQCKTRLASGGRVVATVPSPIVDRILAILRALRLLDGMCLEEHRGIAPAEIVRAFEGAGFRVAVHRRFQLGLNHLFVFVPEEPA